MCRFFIYLGEPISLHQLLDTPHKPWEYHLKSHTPGINYWTPGYPQGKGIYFQYQCPALNKKLEITHKTLLKTSIKDEADLDDKKVTLLMGHVKIHTENKTLTNIMELHPFHRGEFRLMHVGDLWLSQERGFTKDKIVDSDHAFQLFIQAYQKTTSNTSHPVLYQVNKMVKAFKSMLKEIKKYALYPMSANFAIQYQNIILISRYSTTQTPPPMYYRVNYLGKNNIIVCHEPLDYETKGWKLFPTHHLLVAFNIIPEMPNKKNTLYYQFLPIDH